MNVSNSKICSKANAPRALSIPSFNLSGYDLSFPDQKRILEKQRLSYHMSQYQKSRAKALSDHSNVGMIEDVYNYFQINKIKVIKINHCFSDSGSTQFEGYI